VARLSIGRLLKVQPEQGLELLRREQAQGPVKARVLELRPVLELELEPALEPQALQALQALQLRVLWLLLPEQL
jgi:hypothetical protein